MKPPPATKTGARLKALPKPVAARQRDKMKFVILGFDGPDGEAKRKIYRQTHLANMEPLDRAGRVVLAGPLTDKTGSLIVIEANSLEEAQKFARDDPYTVHGVFERVEVHPLTQVFPKPR
jgi:uncharacterized protein YciI